MKIKNSDISPLIAQSSLVIETIDMHTGGEPLRVVTSGYPEIKGDTILEKRAYCKRHLDHIRKFLMYEPRGHADMYGCLIVEANDEEADFGVIFMHNEGYSTMCGHATIAVAKLAVLAGWVERTGPITKIKIDAPCGRLTAFVDQDNHVSFHNVPSFVYRNNLSLELPPYGKLHYDIAYGGAFYGLFDAQELGLSVSPENVNEFIAITKTLKKSINHQHTIEHPFEKDLSFLYGCIFIETLKNEKVHSKNICVFAEGEVDRCPTGSGVSARIALHMDKDEVLLHEAIIVESIIGSRFTVKAIAEKSYGPFNAYIPEVSGDAYITGKNEFFLEDEDTIKEGFLLR